MGNNRDRDDRIEFTGTVVETNKGIFKVQVQENQYVTARISGKLKLLDLKVIVGDRVIVEVSPYDLSLGRITIRLKKES